MSAQNLSNKKLSFNCFRSGNKSCHIRQWKKFCTSKLMRFSNKNVCGKLTPTDADKWMRKLLKCILSIIKIAPPTFSLSALNKIWIFFQRLMCSAYLSSFVQLFSLFFNLFFKLNLLKFLKKRVLHYSRFHKRLNLQQRWLLALMSDKGQFNWDWWKSESKIYR